jgi:hypothetical protein
MKQSEITASQLAMVLRLHDQLRLERRGPDDIINESLAVLDKIEAANNKRSLWMGIRDLPEWLAAESDPELVQKFFEDVKKVTGLTYEDLFGNSDKKVAAVLKRGRVRSDVEWYCLRAYLEQIETDPERQDEVDRVVDILDRYGSQ